jgi:hypothetical protein
MKPLVHLVFSVVVLLQSSFAFATRPGDYAVIHFAPLVFTCMAQSEEFSRPIWNRISGDPAEMTEPEREESDGAFRRALVDSSWAKCVRNRQWVSRSLCIALSASLSETPQRDIGPVLSLHREEVASLKHVFDYYEAARSPDTNSVPCPQH